MQQTVLVVDDALASRELLVELLTAGGLQVQAADSGEQALAMAGATQPDLILLDVRMPDMDGFEVCRLLQGGAATQAIPVIMISGATEAADHALGLRLGAVDFIDKPFHQEELLARVRTHLELGLLRQQLEQRVQEQTSALLASEHFYRDLLEQQGEGFGVVDVSERFVLANPVADDIFGLARGGLVGRNLLEFLEPDQVALVHSQTQERLAGKRSSYELKVRRPSGERRYIQTTVTPGPAAGGSAPVFIGVFRDITDLKQAQDELRESEAQNRAAEARQRQLESQLQQAQNMKSLGSLAGGIAHDMNNVLGAILSLASAHLLIQPRDSQTHQAFATIAEAATRGGKMVKSLLTFARQHPAEERQLDLNALLREDISLLEHTTLAKVRLETSLAPDLWPILGDASALTNAFMNLCVNAVDSMANNGVLTLRTRNLESGQVEVEVADTGDGMSPEILAKAIDPFFTTKEVGKGTGLGLTMAYSTVQAHRGEFAIQSEPGRGTRVLLRFPACVAAAGDATPAEVQLQPARVGLQVLLVDDDDLIQRSTKMLIEVLGFAVRVVGSGEEALAELAGGFRPNVVILDLNMPGIGGAGTLPRLRALCPDVPVLLATGRADQEALDLVEAHPEVTLLAKPFNLEQLQAHLARV